MSKQFLRVAELTILGGTIGRVLKGLRISFEIEKSLLGYPNLARIEVYNPAPQTVELLKKKFTKIILSAGYEDAVTQTYFGQIRNVSHRRVDTDLIVTIFSADGDAAFKNSFVNKTFSENFNLKGVITSVADTLEGIIVGGISPLLDISPDKSRGQTLSGSSKEVLDTLANDYDFNWSVQDEVFTAISSVEVSEDLAVVVNAATGMLGSPALTEIGANVTTLLNPKIVPNGKLVIESINFEFSMGNVQIRDIAKTDASGTYKIQKVTHKGDTHSDTWSSTIEGAFL